MQPPLFTPFGIPRPLRSSPHSASQASPTYHHLHLIHQLTSFTHYSPINFFHSLIMILSPHLASGSRARTTEMHGAEAAVEHPKGAVRTPDPARPGPQARTS